MVDSPLIFFNCSLDYLGSGPDKFSRSVGKSAGITTRAFREKLADSGFVRVHC